MMDNMSEWGSGAVITSPPDAYEIDMDVKPWRLWFHKAVARSIVLAGLQPAVFYVTDRKYNGELVSKAGIIISAATELDRQVMWHKSCLRTDVGRADLFRPTYSHMIAVGTRPWVTPGKATPDVIGRGPVLYANGMGVDAARRAVAYVAGQGARKVYNPFCGRGTVLAAAEEAGLDAVGIDNDEAQCKYSEVAVL
jgi:hypothetical protein